jgi:hypothetical protein
MPKTNTIEEVRLIAGLSPFGAAVHATVYNICWIESEQAFHGKTANGDKYLFWNVSEEGYSREYRRIDC